MNRTILSLVLGGCGLGWLTGCGHMVESRAIQAFADSLQQKDIGKLRANSTDEFEQKTLRDDSLRAFEMLDIPEGKAKVVKVEEADGTKKVTAMVGPEKSKRKVLYELQRDPKTRKWVVDDLYLKDSSSGKAVSEQVNLLVSLREFLDAWNEGDRSSVLATTTAEFGQILGELPPEHLAHLTRRLVAESAEKKNLDPAAQIQKAEAKVQVPQLNGKLAVTFTLVAGVWKVDEASVESRHEGEAVTSVRETAIVTNRALAFQAAYNASDKNSLSRICTNQFFEGSLAAADLSLARLPVTTATEGEFDVKLEGNAALCVVHSPEEIVKISLVRHSTEEAEPGSAPEYRVNEVTIYERNSNQDKRLSALFTSHALMQIFSEALVSRNLETLRLSSTHDFSKRVWERLDAAKMRQMPMREVHAGRPEVLTTLFQGPVTQITVNQGQGPLTYVLRDQSGKMLVDDVLLPVADRPESLKTTWDLMIPISDFASGFQDSAIDVVRANVSREFSRVVWDLIERIPELKQPPERFLMAHVSKINVTAERAVVVFGDDRFGAKVMLTKEKDRFVVDDAILIAGPAPDERVNLKQALRLHLAEGGDISRPPRGVSSAP